MSAFIYVYCRLSVLTKRAVVKSAMPMPTPLPLLAGVRSRTKIRPTRGVTGFSERIDEMYPAISRPITLVSIPEPLMSFPMRSTISRSISSKGNRASSDVAF